MLCAGCRAAMSPTPTSKDDDRLSEHGLFLLTTDTRRFLIWTCPADFQRLREPSMCTWPSGCESQGHRGYGSFPCWRRHEVDLGSNDSDRQRYAAGQLIQPLNVRRVPTLSQTSNQCCRGWPL